ncbi:MAG: molybdenum cofactor guanylyltransferase [Myxococcaceae bacterium]
MAPIVPFPGGDATLAIIAGGRARRLGGIPKGLLELEGRTLIERLLDLAPLFAEVLLGANDPSPYARYRLRTVADRVPQRGSPGGVHAVLEASRTPWVFAVAADMPFVSSQVALALLAARSEDADLVCFQVSGRLEPLLAVYRASLAPAWERALPAEPGFGELFELFRAKVLPQTALATVDPGLRSVVSVNTPQDAERLGITHSRRAAKKLP